jgi:hypothetical protein
MPFAKRLHGYWRGIPSRVRWLLHSPPPYRAGSGASGKRLEPGDILTPSFGKAPSVTSGVKADAVALAAAHMLAIAAPSP